MSHRAVSTTSMVSMVIRGKSMVVYVYGDAILSLLSLSLSLSVSLSLSLSLFLSLPYSLSSFNLFIVPHPPL